MELAVEFYSARFNWEGSFVGLARGVQSRSFNGRR